MKKNGNYEGILNEKKAKKHWDQFHQSHFNKKRASLLLKGKYKPSLLLKRKYKAN